MARQLERILYAEDDEDIRDVAIMALEAMGGFTIQSCEHGQAVVEQVIDFKPDLLLLDVMMPIMDGPTALQQVKAMPEMQSLPVIFMTAKVQPQEIAEYKALGAIDVITKPFDPMTLADRVRQIWDANGSVS
ncbi:response regulator [Magnetococcus sp. PR-3]|uniref:response regulator n=1 Tax=Magnetococcus sp. PR-3 TaxID=3120355 RepID=UPI002FCE5784